VRAYKMGNNRGIGNHLIGKLRGNKVRGDRGVSNHLLGLTSSITLHFSAAFGLTTYFLFMIYESREQDSEMIFVSIQIFSVIMVFMGITPILSSIGGYLGSQKSGIPESKGILFSFAGNFIGSLLGLGLIFVIIAVATFSGSSGDSDGGAGTSFFTILLMSGFANGCSGGISYWFGMNLMLNNSPNSSLPGLKNTYYFLTIFTLIAITAVTLSVALIIQSLY